MPYIPFTEEQKVIANSVDLEHFLRMRGEKLEQVGRESKLIYYDGSGKHDSITIRGSTWFDHKNQTGGGAIKFMQEFYDMNFADAVQELLGYTVSPLAHKFADRPIAEKKKEFNLPPKNNTMHRVYAYLIKQRFVRADVISFFAKKGAIYEDEKYHNAVFVGFDENGVARQAHKRSTNSCGKTFRITCEGSDTDYSFAHFGSSDKLFVFEAPIDMLSFISLYPDNWQQHSYIAMNGVYESAVLKALEQHPDIGHIMVCTDNDEGGIDAFERISDILCEHEYGAISRCSPKNKDWNEDLKAMHGQPVLPAVAHKRKALYYRDISELKYIRCRPEKLTQQFRAAYRTGQLKYLTEYALAGSAFFMRVKDESKGFSALQAKLGREYRAYADKGRMTAKQRALSDKLNEVMTDLRQTARTQEQSIATAKKLFELADCALRVAVQEQLDSKPAEDMSEDVSQDDDEVLMPLVGYG